MDCLRKLNRNSRCDNRPESISATLLSWAQQQGIQVHHIQPGKPQQNADAERFNRTARYKYLSQFQWESLHQVQHAATEWMWSYHHQRTNMALGGITPKQWLTMIA